MVDGGWGEHGNGGPVAIGVEVSNAWMIFVCPWGWGARVFLIVCLPRPVKLIRPVQAIRGLVRDFSIQVSNFHTRSI